MFLYINIAFPRVFPPQISQVFHRCHLLSIHQDKISFGLISIYVISRNLHSQAKPNGTIYKIITIQPSWPDFHNKHQPGIVVSILFACILFLLWVSLACPCSGKYILI